MKTILFATSNHNKVKEVNALLPDNLRILSLKDIGVTKELAETSDTIEGNAIQKVNQLWTLKQQPCFADDTGLEVDALNGEPGVYSARYAGPDKNDQQNMNKLLQELGNKEQRYAHFRSVFAYRTEDGIITFEGILKGTINHHPIGNNGFGYDPIFVPLGSKRSLAEMSLEEKNIISHRSLALKQLIDYIKSTS